MSSPKSFNIDVSDALLSSIKSKLEDARLPEGSVALDASKKWDYGCPPDEITKLRDYWLKSFDWRKAESKLNEMPQFTMDVMAEGHESINLHFVHKRSSRPDAIPLLFSHGWPGNFTEVEKLLPLLTEPPTGQQAYHVVAPSLPGFVFSSSPKKPGFDIYAIAATLNQLMVDLQYTSYIAQGGDWGSFISRALAQRHSETCRAIHVNMFVTPPPSKYNPFEVVKYLAGGYSAQEIAGLKATQHFIDAETGYQQIQGTKPQTLNVGLADSPIGMLAWVLEKLHTWTDNYPWTEDEVLTWVMLYYITARPATHIYKENSKTRKALVSAHHFVPVGVSVFPHDLYQIPQSWAAKIAHIVSWKTHDRGGHFAATETPELLVQDINEFVGKLKSSPRWLEKAKF